MSDKILTATDKRTGTKVRFHWKGDGSPQKEDLDQIFAEQHKNAKSAVEKAGTDFDVAHPGATEVNPVSDVAGRALRGFSQAYGIDPLNPPTTPAQDNRSTFQKFRDELPSAATMALGPISQIPGMVRGAVEQGKGLYNDISSGNYAGAVGRGLGLGSQFLAGKLAPGAEVPPIEAPTPAKVPMAARPTAVPRGLPGPANGIPKAPAPPIVDAEFTDVPPRQVGPPVPQRQLSGGQVHYQGPVNEPKLLPPGPPVPPRQVAAPNAIRQLPSAESSPNFYQGGGSVQPPTTVEASMAQAPPQAPPATTVNEANIPPDPWLVKPPPAVVEPQRRGIPLEDMQAVRSPTIVDESNIPQSTPEPPMAGPVQSPIKPPQPPTMREAVSPEGPISPTTEPIKPSSGLQSQRNARINKAGQLETLENVPISDISPTNDVGSEAVNNYIKNPPSLENSPQLKPTPESETPYEAFEGNHRITAAAQRGLEEIPAWKMHPGETPETEGTSDESYDKIDKYFDNLKSVEGNTKPSPLLAELSQQAKDLNFSPEQFENDLREYGVSEPDIDKTLSSTYGKDLLSSQVGETRGPLRQIAENLLNDTKGGLELQKKNWKSKIPVTTTNQTGLISKPLRYAEGAVSSTDQFLDTNPVTRPISEAARAAYFGPSGEMAFKSDVLNKFNEIHRSLTPPQLKDLHDVMEGAQSNDPQVNSAAKQERAVFDYVQKFAESKGVTRASGKPMRYMSDYLTHIMKDDTFGDVATDYLKHLFGDAPGANLKERLMGSEQVPLKAGQGANLGNESIGTPKTPYAESRFGTKKPLVSDMDTIARRYTESMGRAAFRGPVIKKAAAIIDKMPPGPDKYFAEYYVKKYGGLTQDSPLTQVDKGLARMGARSVLAFSPKLQMLHAIRLVGQGVPELGMKYVAQGAHSALTDLNGAFARAQRYGLIDSVPNKMKTGSEMFDKVANFADLGNNLTKVIMHEGNRAKLQGTSPDWETKAASETSRQEGMVNPTSPVYALDKIPKLVSQFKTYPQKYLENVIRSGLQGDKAGAVKFGRYLAAGLGLYGLSKTTGYAFQHLRGRNLLSLSSPQYEFLTNLGKHLTSFSQADRNGNTGAEKAVKDIVRFAVPAGEEFTKENKKGDLEFKPPSLSDTPEKATHPKSF